jgi:PAS domain-containing protein
MLRTKWLEFTCWRQGCEELVAHRFLSGIMKYGEWAFVLTPRRAARLARAAQPGDIRRRGEAAEITHWLSVAGGETIFPLLAQNLARALAAECVLIGELADGGKDSLRSLAAWAHGRLLDDFECPWAGTPFERVLRERILTCYPHGVREQFPWQGLPQELAAGSILETPLLDSAGRVIGLIAVLDERPLCNLEEAEELLPLFAVRAAAELERRRAEEELRNSEALLHTVFDQAFQLMGLMKPDGTLIKINRSAADSIRTDVATVLNRPFWETPWWAHSPELQERLRAAIREAAEGKLVRFEVTHPSPGGELMYVDFSIKPVLDSIGQVILLVPEARHHRASGRSRPCACERGALSFGLQRCRRRHNSSSPRTI